jgi:hypothetical protein
MSSAAKGSAARQVEINEILSGNFSTRATSQQKEEAKNSDSRFAAIEANPFFNAVFDAETTPDQKQEAIAKLLTFTGTVAEVRENVKAFSLFKEYLQSVREEMAVDTIKMSDPKNFAVLRDTYESMNGGLIDFENKISPLTDLLEALEELRMSGETMDVFREIKGDEERTAAIKAREAELLSQIEAAKSNIKQFEVKTSQLDNEKGWFGFGGITKEAKNEQARLNILKQEELARLDKIAADVASVEQELSNLKSNTGKNSDAKKRLREMLDMSSEGHETRGNELIESAVSFVATSKEKIGTIRDHLSNMEQQILNLHDASDNMTFTFALLDGGTKLAEKENKSIREGLMKVGENESTVDRITRENKKRDIDEHIATLENSANDTTATIADLTSQSIRIKDMKDSNQGQIQMAQEMHARGVAGVADRISTVIQAVGQAALSESSQMAAHTLDAMRQNTDMLAQKHSLQVAMGIHDRNESLEKAIANLEQYGKVHQEATKITKAGLSDMKNLVNRMEESAKAVAEDVSRSYALAADNVMGGGTDAPKKGEAATPKTKSPFGPRN